MIIHFIKYRNIYFNPLIWRLLTIIILICLNIDYYYCDNDNELWFSNTDNNGEMPTTTSSGENNAQFARHGYQTHYRDGTPIYQSYNENYGELSNRTGYQTNNERPNFQAYNENLQLTSKGYRYEMNGDTSFRDITNPALNQDNFIAELDGNTVYAKYYGTDVDGNNVYSYSSDGSTMIGLIEPTKSEIIGNGYYVGGPHWKIVDTSPTKFYRRVYNKIKIGIKNHIAKSSDESLRISRFESKRYAENLGRAKRMARARDAQRYADRYSTRAIKVRKFD